jgi:hypothetical protein
MLPLGNTATIEMGSSIPRRSPVSRCRTPLCGQSHADDAALVADAPEKPKNAGGHGHDHDHGDD